MLFLVENVLTRQDQDSTFFLASARTEANFSSRFALAAWAFSITESAHAKYSSRRSNGQFGGGSVAISPTLWILSPSLMSVPGGVLDLQLLTSCLRQTLVVGDFLDEHAHGFTEVVAEFGGSGLGILNSVVENRRCQYGRIVDFADFHKDVCHGDGVVDIG
tara:strand:- start:349 stop:831 length:483 start_codon:yes stop_codon:yes gene_type:complete